MNRSKIWSRRTTHTVTYSLSRERKKERESKGEEKSFAVLLHRPEHHMSETFFPVSISFSQFCTRCNRSAFCLIIYCVCVPAATEFLILFRLSLFGRNTAVSSTVFERGWKAFSSFFRHTVESCDDDGTSNRARTAKRASTNSPTFPPSFDKKGFCIRIIYIFLSNRLKSYKSFHFLSFGIRSERKRLRVIDTYGLAQAD